MTKQELKEKVENLIDGECIADYMTKTEAARAKAYLRKWLKTAQPGDTYYECDCAFTIS